MRRAIATVGTMALLILPLAACGDGAQDAGVKAGSAPTTELAETSGLPTDLPSDLPTELPSDLPTGLPTDVPTELPTDGGSEAPAGALDACAIVTKELISADFGAKPGQSTRQQSSFGDSNAQDCYWFGGDVVMVVQATTRADQDLPEGSYSYAGLPGAEEVPGADRGWAYVFPGQSGSTIVSGLILVKGQTGLNFSITVDGHPYDNQTLRAFAQHVLAAI